VSVSRLAAMWMKMFSGLVMKNLTSSNSDRTLFGAQSIFSSRDLKKITTQHSVVQIILQD
jgi:hypothetical protein